MRVKVLNGSEPHSGAELGSGTTTGSRDYGGWAPHAVCGADAPGGLLLPQATPTIATMYAPRGVWIDEQRLIACDTGNHRVLIWNSIPSADGTPADVVLGQADAASEGPAAGGAGPENGMHLPTGVLVAPDGRLVVADAWHHRILIWNAIPDSDGTPPDTILGQPDSVSVEENRGGAPSAKSFYWPFGIALAAGRFVVCDSGNRRLLVWNDGLPEADAAADFVLGQPSFSSRDENRGEEASASSFRWPHAAAADDQGGLIVCDAGNHRLLRWMMFPIADRSADAVLGQPDFTSNGEFPYISQQGRLRFPYAALAGPGLAIADTANNRVLLWDEVPDDLRSPAAVLAQPDAEQAGENRWSSVERDTLCWPYGIARHGDLLAVADSGNNRVVIWRRSEGH